MKKYKTVEVPASTRQELLHRECDFCGKTSNSDDWDTGYYTTNETEIGIKIKHSEGNNWPSGGCGEEFKCDMCPDCFRNKLVPYLKMIAKNPVDYNDWSW